MAKAVKRAGRERDGDWPGDATGGEGGVNVEIGKAMWVKGRFGVSDGSLKGLVGTGVEEYGDESGLMEGWEDLRADMEVQIKENDWLARRRSFVRILVGLVAGGGGKDSDATRFRALDKLLELVDKTEDESKGAFAPTVEGIDDAIEILTRIRDEERRCGKSGDALCAGGTGEAL